MAKRGASKPAGRSRCDGRAERPADVSLPVVTGRQTIRRSRSGPRRAIVLLIVQLLLVAHVVHWIWTGRSITPIEPSESMEFVKHGVVNAGLIFFAVALLSTLVLGRWFCGWGCHVVMLQDGCGWVMKKLGVRPKPFRSRLLAYVPLLLALYMFVWPAFYRLALAPFAPKLRDAAAALPEWLQIVVPVAPGVPAWSGELHLTTTEFWQTFPPWWVAVPFLLICGLATVYFLGAKGFCTYGCPYGGFFAPIDELSPARIRVTDACEQCGHCTAVCTSNVRVHEEVHQYGMVVDSGCMKCLDCVSVCPNDALYFGLGRPAFRKGEPRHGGAAKLHDFTWRQEIALAIVFAVTFFCVRGAYGIVPMLMAAGVAGCVTFIAWKLWGLAARENVNLHRFRLKLKGRVTRAGLVYAAPAALVCLMVLHTGVVKGAFAVGEHFDRRAQRSPSIVYGPSPPPMSATQRRDADRAIGLYELARGVNDGGIGPPSVRVFGERLPWHVQLDLRRARLHADALDFEAAERILREIIERDGRSDLLCSSLGWVLFAQDREAAWTFSRDVLLETPGLDGVLADVISRASADGTLPRVVELCAERLQRHPEDGGTLRWLARFRLEAGRPDESVALLHRYIERAPDDPAGHLQLGQTFGAMGRLDEARSATAVAVELAPDDPAVNTQMAAVLDALGLPDEAHPYRQRAEALQRRAHRTDHGQRGGY